MEKLKTRKDRTPTVLRKLAKSEPDRRVMRRLLAIANALSGMSRVEAAKSAGMDRQTLRDWVIRYNAHGVARLSDSWKGGRAPAVKALKAALRRLGSIERNTSDTNRRRCETTACTASGALNPASRPRSLITR